MTIVPTIRYTESTRLYEIVELIVLDNGESCDGEVIESGMFTFGEVRRRFYKLTGNQESIVFNFVIGTVFGIIVSTVGFASLAKVADGGVVKVKEVTRQVVKE